MCTWSAIQSKYVCIVDQYLCVSEIEISNANAESQSRLKVDEGGMDHYMRILLILIRLGYPMVS